MSLLTTHELAKSFGPEDIFDAITVEIPHKARIALVGPNGAGKTTLLNLLVGLDVPSEGTIATARGLRMGFLPQRPELHGTHTLWEEQLRAFDNLREMEVELERLHDAMAANPDDHHIIDAYGHLQESFELADGYTYETRIKAVLQGVGFTPNQYETPLSKLSGGQKTRALLARLLLDAPDLLILDEPTNHLDIESVEWLESYLRDFPGAVLAVSHDRYFMDRFASVIWELQDGTLELYRGNYSHYIQQRHERHERLRKEYEAQQEFIAKEIEYIRRNIAGQNTRQAKGRLKRLETMKKRGVIMQRPRGKRRDMHLRIQAAVRSGDKVLMTEEVAVGYPDAPKPLFEVPDLTLYRGETVALIGPNGVGKSTFLKTITGQLDPLRGEVRLGAGVRIGYFAQAHESLDPKRTIIDEVIATKTMLPAEARNYLGGFLFSGDDVYRPIGTLSGGERGRVALAKLALTGANLLLLDEPTNHLDIDSQEVLQSVIADFNGTVILVTHDRYLVDALATQIWWVQPGQFTLFEGPYQEFLADREKRRQLALAASEAVEQRPKSNGASNGSTAQSEARSNGKPAHGLNPYQLKQRVAEVEAQIIGLEETLTQLTDALNEASASGDGDKVRDLSASYTQAEADLAAAMSEWELLVE
jgi:ATP-binding cassette subfamily F protein 3